MVSPLAFGEPGGGAPHPGGICYVSGCLTFRSPCEAGRPVVEDVATPGDWAAEGLGGWCGRSPSVVEMGARGTAWREAVWVLASPCGVCSSPPVFT